MKTQPQKLLTMRPLSTLLWQVTHSPRSSSTSRLTSFSQWRGKARVRINILRTLTVSKTKKLIFLITSPKLTWTKSKWSKMITFPALVLTLTSLIKWLSNARKSMLKLFGSNLKMNSNVMIFPRSCSQRCSPLSGTSISTKIQKSLASSTFTTLKSSLCQTRVLKGSLKWWKRKKTWKNTIFLRSANSINPPNL